MYLLIGGLHACPASVLPVGYIPSPKLNTIKISVPQLQLPFKGSLVTSGYHIEEHLASSQKGAWQPCSASQAGISISKASEKGITNTQKT